MRNSPMEKQPPLGRTNITDNLGIRRRLVRALRNRLYGPTNRLDNTLQSYN